MGKITFFLVIVLGSLAFLVWILSADPDPSPQISAVSPVTSTTAPTDMNGPVSGRVLFINSYHEGYPWSDGIFAAFAKSFDLHQQQEPDFWRNGDLVIQTFYMDSKRNSDEKSKLAAAAQAKKLIESWQPDIVVTSDDNAVKYVVVPVLKNSTLPFVFCGVNMDASEYELPRNQVTGMIEVQPVDQIITDLMPFSRGTRIGFLRGNDLSAIKVADASEKLLGVSLKRRLISNFEEWLTAYREMQQDCDILLIGHHASIRGWDAARAKQLIATETRIPTATWDAWMREYALVTFSTVPEEQGIWAAAATRDILAGKSPADIPITRNHKANIYRNMAIAKQLKIIFPMEFIRRSWAVEQSLSE